jgi:hypothetical protein
LAPLLAMVSDWRLFLAGDLAEQEAEARRRHERIGRPLGDAAVELEAGLGRRLRPGKRGRPEAMRPEPVEVNWEQYPRFSPNFKRIILQTIRFLFLVAIQDLTDLPWH